MEKEFNIVKVKGREILDSRGNPTVEAEVTLCDGSRERASVPSGASTGAFEAVELRDNDEKRYMGMGVKKAVDNVNIALQEAVKNMNALSQVLVDRAMREADGTMNKERLGANAILSVSLAASRAAAAAIGLPLYQYLGGVNARVLPVPMMNILNGGRHASSSLNIQEFMIMPVGAKSFSQALRQSTEVFKTLKEILKRDGYQTSVGDEGGFAPLLSSDEEALVCIVNAITEAGYKPGEDFVLALDIAATEMYEEAKKQLKSSETGSKYKYLFWKSGVVRDTDEMIEYYAELCEKYPIASIEDGLAEEDWEGFSKLTKRLGDKIQLVGDDLFVTNTKRIAKGIELSAANSVLIKVNQIGTLTETFEAVRMAREKGGFTVIVSHRSGETEDTTIADIAVAMNAGQIKTGAPSRSDRTSKYNRLLRIEEQLGEAALYMGKNCFKQKRQA